jgi:hypothetical protein
LLRGISGLIAVSVSRNTDPDALRCTGSSTWQDTYTAQMLHGWVVPYPGGVFSDDLSAAATNAAVQAVLAEHT